MKCEPPGFTAFRGNNVDIRIAVVGGGEGDPFAVRRKFGVELVASAGGDADSGATFARSGPEIARVREDDFVFGYVSVAEEARRSGGRLASNWHSRRSRLQPGGGIDTEQQDQEKQRHQGQTNVLLFHSGLSNFSIMIFCAQPG